jgi:hypothetical protein
MARPIVNDTVGSLCLQLHAKANEYAEVAVKRAKAEATYKAERAKRKLRARADGEAKSMAEADTITDADPVIAQLHLEFLIADGMTDALTKGMIALRERIGYGRSLMANEREADKLLATSRELT